MHATYRTNLSIDSRSDLPICPSAHLSARSRLMHSCEQPKVHNTFYLKSFTYRRCLKRESYYLPLYLMNPIVHNILIFALQSSIGMQMVDLVRQLHFNSIFICLSFLKASYSPLLIICDIENLKADLSSSYKPVNVHPK